MAHRSSTETPAAVGARQARCGYLRTVTLALIQNLQGLGFLVLVSSEKKETGGGLEV